MSSFLNQFTQTPAFFYIAIGLLGALTGSFLNVVIYRLPRMMKNAWRAECLAYLEQPESADLEADTRFNLCTPRSHCPNCDVMIPLWHNIPVLSYLILGGCCHQCKTQISPRYLFIEILCVVISLITALQFGISWQTAAALLLSWVLIAQSGIDIEHHLIPDNLTLPILWVGLFVNLNHLFVPLHEAVIGAIAGYLSLWIVAKASKPIFKRETMGHGDFKLLAMLGAWLGWKVLPFILLCSSLLGSVIGLLLIALNKHAFQREMPFGPYLALAGWAALIWGAPILQWYFSGMSL